MGCLEREKNVKVNRVVAFRGKSVSLVVVV